MLAALTVFGPTWLNNIGIAIAVIAGVVALGVLWKQVLAERREHGQQVVGYAQAQTEALHAERTHSGAVLETMRQHNQQAADRLVEARRKLAEVTAELSSARGSKAALEAEVAQLRGTIASLRQDLAAREAEIRALTDDDAELVTMPRRVWVDPASELDILPSADDMWEAGEYPTVVDLQSLATPVAEQERRQA